MYNTLAQEVARLRREVAEIRRGQRVAHGASIENAALEVRDDAGQVRVTLGVQSDGTVGVVAQNGPPPGALTAPIVTPSIAGLRVTWDGALADGSTLPLDFDHAAVHVSTTSGFTPSAATFAGTITSAGSGGMLPVTPLPYAQHYVRLIGVNTSGAEGAPSAETSGTPVQVDGPDLTAGSVTAEAIQAGAVEADKLAAIIALATRILAGNASGARVELNENGLKVYDGSGALKVDLDAATGDATFTGDITGSNITGSEFQTAATGERITINEAGANKILVYDATGRPVGELSGNGLLLEGSSGAVMQLDPDSTYPNLRFTNASGSNQAVINVVEAVTGDADLGLNSGTFTGSGYSDMIWRTFFGRDFWAAERVRNTSQSTYVGGRIFMDGTSAQIGYLDATAATQRGDAVFTTGNVQLRARLQHLPPASSNTAMYMESAAGHTGHMLRLYNNDAGAYRLSVDLAGNTTIGGILTAPNIVTGSVSITPSAANTPTSVTVNGLNLPGTVHRAFVTAQSQVPGTVLECTATNVNANSLTVWVSRTNTTTTNIWYLVIAS
ncbi:conserved hypothetical protein [Streptomyces himastatinicus ATCC 53653]|uniref:Uncharacterized protein n=1 Tax=Streptomyces himastatinicus ATCC 53653 TaxID=457427 RepID=D9WWW8_9ACTN|nr:hypothetical protein [Streptomyces himastatinicus]EFL29396.1 conserved hypothetical protein [Streptomyces himastatinicus ATCC 53653]